MLATPLVRFTLEQRQCQPPREEPSARRTCQTRCMRQQRAGKSLLIKKPQSGPPQNQAGNTEHTVGYGSAAAQQRAPTRAPMRSSMIASANCASVARSRARRDRDGIVGSLMMASRAREAAGCRVSASRCGGGNDSILREFQEIHRDLMARQDSLSIFLLETSNVLITRCHDVHLQVYF